MSKKIITKADLEKFKEIINCYDLASNQMQKIKFADNESQYYISALNNAKNFFIENIIDIMKKYEYEGMKEENMMLPLELDDTVKTRLNWQRLAFDEKVKNEVQNTKEGINIDFLFTDRTKEDWEKLAFDKKNDLISGSLYGINIPNFALPYLTSKDVNFLKKASEAFPETITPLFDPKSLKLDGINVKSIGYFEVSDNPNFKDYIKLKSNFDNITVEELLQDTLENLSKQGIKVAKGQYLSKETTNVLLQAKIQHPDCEIAPVFKEDEEFSGVNVAGYGFIDKETIIKKHYDMISTDLTITGTNSCMSDKDRKAQQQITESNLNFYNKHFKKNNLEECINDIHKHEILNENTAENSSTPIEETIQETETIKEYEAQPA